MADLQDQHGILEAMTVSDGGEEEDCFCAGRVVEVHSHVNGQVNGLKGEVVRREGGCVVIRLPEPWGECSVKECCLRPTDWQKMLSNSTSPGDHYWYNYETGESTWEEPDELRLQGGLHSQQNSEGSSSEEVSASPADTPTSAGMQTFASKESELEALRSRLQELERAKKRRLQQSAHFTPYPASTTTTSSPAVAAPFRSILKSRSVLDQKLNALEPLVHGFKVVPHATVPLAD